jgi:hypothetical protein
MCDMMSEIAQSKARRRMTTKSETAIAEAILAAFVSPNVLDSNLEPANIVDAIHGVRLALERIARVAESYDDSDSL